MEQAELVGDSLLPCRTRWAGKRDPIPGPALLLDFCVEASVRPCHVHRAGQRSSAWPGASRRGSQCDCVGACVSGSVCVSTLLLHFLPLCLSLCLSVSFPQPGQRAHSRRDMYD